VGKELDPLAKDYLKKFQTRVKALQVYFDDEVFSDVMREGQEALELFLKALLRAARVEPEFNHEPSRQLLQHQADLPSEFKNQLPELIQWSKRLRRIRELAFYGAPDFIPSQEFSKEEAVEVMEFLKRLAKKAQILS